jgi:hypothetical protein
MGEPSIGATPDVSGRPLNRGVSPSGAEELVGLAFDAEEERLCLLLRVGDGTSTGSKIGQRCTRRRNP